MNSFSIDQYKNLIIKQKFNYLINLLSSLQQHITLLFSNRIITASIKNSYLTALNTIIKKLNKECKSNLNIHQPGTSIKQLDLYIQNFHKYIDITKLFPNCDGIFNDEFYKFTNDMFASIEHDIISICNNIGFPGIHDCVSLMVCENFQSLYSESVNKFIELYNIIVIPVKSTLLNSTNENDKKILEYSYQKSTTLNASNTSFSTMNNAIWICKNTTLNLEDPITQQKIDSKQTVHNIFNTSTEDIKNDEQINKFIDIIIQNPINKSLYMMSTCFFIADPANLIVSSSVNCFDTVYKRKSHLHDVLKHNNICDNKFIKKFMDHIDLYDIILLNDAEFIDKVKYQYKMYNRLTN
ncbi:MAG: ATP-dependent Lon protease, partial [Faunusvirus sp.]